MNPIQYKMRVVNRDKAWNTEAKPMPRKQSAIDVGSRLAKILGARYWTLAPELYFGTLMNSPPYVNKPSIKETTQIADIP
jgi:hypothetical protein